MTLKHECGHHETLVSYLYDECEPAERTAVAAHLAVCGRCASELADLRGTRAELATWRVPDVPLGIRLPDAVVGPVAAAPRDDESIDAAPVLRPARWWHRPMPAWAQAAAAAVIFTVGVGLGALRATTTSPTATAAAGDGAAAAVSHDDLAALEQRLREEMASQIHQVAAPAAAPAAHGGTSGISLEQVRALIAESERRQQRELALRSAELSRDFDRQRRGDLAQIERSFGQMEGLSDVQAEQQRQMMNYLMRVAQRPQ